ncbi:106aa long hypothetical protein [Pyrococcus horikoshii OT3]|uniref:Uncharacterized protein n=1 Tax=Pyrococcus horikoshii (strain ATCC 700860 / DSM 12428 / JCM 9974 / NBRC 100139 / OT-3) TaxID=70601 RepID=O58519_PYRHO|nr:106aa long hypothetical protein [Pyrococcus horikoshii OT3]
MNFLVVSFFLSFLQKLNRKSPTGPLISMYSGGKDYPFFFKVLVKYRNVYTSGFIDYIEICPLLISLGRWVISDPYPLSVHFLYQTVLPNNLSLVPQSLKALLRELQ